MVTVTSPWVYEQVFETTFTLVTFSVGIEPVAAPEAAAPVVPEAVVPAPVVPVAPVVPAPVVPAVLPGVVEPELVMLPAPASIVPVNSTFWFTYWLSVTVEPAFSISVLCAPMLAVEPVEPVAPVVPAVPVAPAAVPPAPVSIFVNMNWPAPVMLPAPAVLPAAPAVPVAPAVVPGVVAPDVLGVVLPIEPLALYGIRHPVTVMVLPACALGVVCEVDGVDVL